MRPLLAALLITATAAPAQAPDEIQEIYLRCLGEAVRLSKPHKLEARKALLLANVEACETARSAAVLAATTTKGPSGVPKEP